MTKKFTEKQIQGFKDRHTKSVIKVQEAREKLHEAAYKAADRYTESCIFEVELNMALEMNKFNKCPTN